MGKTAKTGQYEPQTARGRATRQALLAAAEDVFGELSYDRASISEITRRAGVAQGTFYVYFPDKRSAFVELVHLLNHDMRRAIAEAIAGIDDRLEVERIGFRAFFEFALRHKTLYRVVRECEFVDPETYRWHYATLATGYVRGLKQAQSRDQISDAISADTIAWLLLGIAEFMGGRWILGEGTTPPPEIFEEIMTFISCALSPRRTAA